MALPPDEPNDEEELEELPDDYDTPFNIPDDDQVDIADGRGEAAKRPLLDDTHPSTDANIELSEAYHAGLSNTANASEPNATDNVIGYDDLDDEDEAA